MRLPAHRFFVTPNTIPYKIIGIIIIIGIHQPISQNVQAMRTLSLKAPAAGQMAANCGTPCSIGATMSRTVWRLRVLARWMIITTMAAHNDFYNFGRTGGVL